jgi:hypothetical protein
MCSRSTEAARATGLKTTSLNGLVLDTAWDQDSHTGNGA